MAYAPLLYYTLFYSLPSTPPLSADTLLDAMLVGVTVTEASPIPESELKVKSDTPVTIESTKG